MHIDAWPALVAVVVGYAGSIAVWQTLRRRWRLAGPVAPRREELGPGERAARRNLELLLAFDALVVVPLLPLWLVLVIAVVQGGGDPLVLFTGLAVYVLFLAPVPALLHRIRVHEAFRQRGLPEPTLVRQIATGHASLDELLRRRPVATQVTAGLIVAVSLACLIDPALGRLLAKDNAAIRAGQAWRLVTVALVHAGAVHLFFNVSVFLDVGGVVERLAGWWQMLVVFWGGTAAGTLVSAAVFPNPSVGASGGVFALLGALWAIAYRHRHELPPIARARFGRSTATVIGVNVLLGFALPYIDWGAHLGGLAAGAAMGWLFGLGPDARAALAPRPGAGRALP